GFRSGGRGPGQRAPLRVARRAARHRAGDRAARGGGAGSAIENRRVVRGAGGVRDREKGPQQREEATMTTDDTFRLKVGLAEMLKGGVIMDVVNADQARIAEAAGATAVLALERVSR